MMPIFSARRLVALLLLLVVVALAGCSPAGAPEANSRPVKPVRISGALDASLDLRVFTRYFTAARTCRRADNLFRWLDGKAQPQSTWVESDVQRGNDGYTATIHLDHFEPGKCGWHPFVIAFQVTTRDGLITGQIVAGPDGQRRLVPGPESKVWVDAAPAEGSRREARPAAHRHLAPLELACREHVVPEVTALTCLPEIPRGLAMISQQTTEVRVDFSDRTAGAAR